MAVKRGGVERWTHEGRVDRALMGVEKLAACLMMFFALVFLCACVESICCCACARGVGLAGRAMGRTQARTVRGDWVDRTDSGHH